MSLIKLNKKNKWVVITTIHVLIRGGASSLIEPKMGREGKEPT